MDSQIKIRADGQGEEDAGDANGNTCLCRYTGKGVWCRQQWNAGTMHTYKRKTFFPKLNKKLGKR